VGRILPNAAVDRVATNETGQQCSVARLLRTSKSKEVATADCADFADRTEYYIAQSFSRSDVNREGAKMRSENEGELTFPTNGGRAARPAYSPA
jgi:hypothetical protein